MPSNLVRIVFQLASRLVVASFFNAKCINMKKFTFLKCHFYPILNNYLEGYTHGRTDTVLYIYGYFIEQSICLIPMRRLRMSAEARVKIKRLVEVLMEIFLKIRNVFKLIRIVDT